MSIKLGSKNIILPYSKAYLGSKLVYQKSGYEDIEFTECPFPTEWTEITKRTEYTATNDYGEWRIWADKAYSTSMSSVHYAFDGSNSTSYYWKSGYLESNEQVSMGIDLPIDVSICPVRAMVKARYLGDDAMMLGLNTSTGEWDELCELYSSTSWAERYFDITTNNFYSKFKLKTKRYNSSDSEPFVSEFQITSGIIRKII